MDIFALCFETPSRALYDTEGRARLTKWAASVVAHKPAISARGEGDETLFEFLQKKNATLYTPRLNFFGYFLIYQLFERGYTWEKPLKNNKTFYATIGSNGVWHSLHILHRKQGKRRYYSAFINSSDKLLIDPVELPEAYEIPFEVSEEDIEAQARAVSLVLYDLNKIGMKSTSLSQDCLREFRGMLGEKKFNSYFPRLSYNVYNFIRPAYIGGYNYINPQHVAQLVIATSADINSAYSWAMKERLMPYGQPLKYRGEPPAEYPLYIHRFIAQFYLKAGFLPTVKMRDRPDVGGDYLTSISHPIEMTMSSVDFEIFKKHYKIVSIDHIGGYAFTGRSDIFADYVDKWFTIKSGAKTKTIKTIAKHHLNRLYGVFGKYVTRYAKVPIYAGGKITWQTVLNNAAGGYMPIAIFTAAYVRERIINAAQLFGKSFICAATDSFKYLTPSTPAHLTAGTIGDRELGGFKIEYEGAPFKILKHNTYIYSKDGETVVVCSGIPSKSHKYIADFDKFDFNVEIPVEQAMQVKGGAILYQDKFTITP